MVKKIFDKFFWVLNLQLGLNFRRTWCSIKGVPRYIADWAKFRQQYQGAMAFRPCLHDWHEEGGATTDEYFWQDLHVARKIYLASPQRHVDIGSRVDGFVAHLATFRDVQVFDIRPLSTLIPGVEFRQADLTRLSEPYFDYCDSLSSLHALEHFGLGRYGDPVDPQGYKTGLANMARMLKSGGVFYLAVPIGRECVEFNAHRVFEPRALVQLAASSCLALRDFAWVESGRTLHQSDDPTQELVRLAKLDYALGIFTFVKQ